MEICTNGVTQCVPGEQPKGQTGLDLAVVISRFIVVEFVFSSVPRELQRRLCHTIGWWTDTVGYNLVKIFDPAEGRNCSRAYSRQYEADWLARGPISHDDKPFVFDGDPAVALFTDCRGFFWREDSRGTSDSREKSKPDRVKTGYR
jgi:hypothetical protein